LVFQRILLALEPGDSGPVATSFTIALARSCNAAVQVVHVDEYVARGRGVTCAARAGGTGVAASVVAAAMAEMEDAGVPAAGATYRIATFDVAAAIGDLADQCRADVIVLGSRRRRFGSLLRRSMRDRVTRHTQLPVLLAPAPLNVGRDGRNGRGLGELAGFGDLASCASDRAEGRERSR
jgi:nucleotide-binding universal stress UspA family protein